MNDVNNLMEDYTPKQRIKALVACPCVFLAMYAQMVCVGAGYLFDGVANTVGNWIQK